MMQTNEQELMAFVEKLGHFFGVESRMPRSVARILAFLLVCRPAHQSAKQIAERLKLSTGAVNGAVNILQQIGLVKRVSFSGDRQYYYEADPDGWRQVMRMRLQTLPRGIALAKEGMQFSDKNPRLQAMHDIYAIFESELETFIERLNH
jgi:DNA-binding transcriptional regulator GbsR (MarR family)